MSYRRFVALGDSTTEGLVDPNPDGSFRGWADRLAERLAEDEPELRYANLAVRGKLARQVRAEQLDAAVALEPDLASVLSGLNDMLRKNVDVAAVAGEIEAMVVALRGAGADVLTVTFPDPVPVNPLASRAAARVRRLNAMIRDLSADARREARRPRGAPGLLRPAAVGHRPPAREPRGPSADRARRRRGAGPRRRRRRAGPSRTTTRSARARGSSTRSGRGSTSRRG